jgi:hypothetical protein
MSKAALAERLMRMAARRSVETQFGWAHPDCADLEEAARLLRGEPEPAPQPDVGVIDAVTTEAN